MRIIVEKETLFYFRKLEPLSDSTFNTLFRDKELSIASPSPSGLSRIENNDNLLSAHFSDNDSPTSLERSINIYNKLIQYGLVSQYIALSAVI